MMSCFANKNIIIKYHIYYTSSVYILLPRAFAKSITVARLAHLKLYNRISLFYVFTLIKLNIVDR